MSVAFPKKEEGDDFKNKLSNQETMKIADQDEFAV